MKLTDLQGNKVEVDFNSIKAHVGKIRYYHRYRMNDGTYINVKEDLHQIRALREALSETVVEEDDGKE